MMLLEDQLMIKRHLAAFRFDARELDIFRSPCGFGKTYWIAQRIERGFYQ
jgi:hypothetical protein